MKQNNDSEKKMAYQFQDEPGSEARKLLEQLAYTRRVVYHHQDETFTGNREGFIKHCLYEMAQLDISSTANARTTGEILVALKRLMKPGEFTKLFEEKKVPFKHRAANNLMMLYRVTLNHPELLSLDRSIIYVLGTKGFKEEVWSLLAESGVGCYDIKYKEVLVLKSALQSGEIAPDSIELDHFFKKKGDIDVKERIKVADQKIITSVNRIIVEHERFIKQQINIAGPAFVNEFTEHSQFVKPVLEETVSAIISGPNVAKVVAEKIAERPEVLIPAIVGNPSPQVAKETMLGMVVEGPGGPRSKARNSMTYRAIQEFEVAPCDVHRNEDVIPDETIVSSQNANLDDLTVGDYWIQGDENISDETLARRNDLNIGDAIGEYWSQQETDRFYKATLCIEDFVEYSWEAGMFYKDFLCADDFLESVEA